MSRFHSLILPLLLEYTEGVSTHGFEVKMSNDRKCLWYWYKDVNVPTYYIEGEGFTTRLVKVLHEAGAEVIADRCDYDGGSFEFFVAIDEPPLPRMYGLEYDGPLLYDFKTEQDFLDFKSAWEHGPTPQHRVDRAPCKFPCQYTYHMHHGVAYTTVGSDGVARDIPLNTLVMTYYYKRY